MLEKISEKAIDDVYKNAHIALQSITDILPSVEDKNLKAELKAEYKGYKKNIDQLTSFMEKNGMTPKDINPFKKVFMAASIKGKTFFDSSKNNIAEMMIKGTVMGINELTAMKNENQNYDEEVADKIDSLLALEESYEQNLKKYL